MGQQLVWESGKIWVVFSCIRCAKVVSATLNDGFLVYECCWICTVYADLAVYTEFLQKLKLICTILMQITSDNLLTSATVQWCLCANLTLSPIFWKYLEATMSRSLSKNHLDLVEAETFWLLSILQNRERKCADTIGTVLVLWAGYFQF